MLLIPKVIHQIWAGPDPFPYAFKAASKSWSDNHPDWQRAMWFEDDLDDPDQIVMLNRGLYDRAREMSPNDWLRWRSDIARLEVLYRYGGVYCDTDSESLKPLDDLLDNVSCFFIQSPNDLKGATQAVCGAVPEHPFIKHLLDRLHENAMSFKPGSRLVETVGGSYITRELRRVRPDDVAVFAAELFAGRSIRERDRGIAPRLSQAYVDHQYNNTDRMRNQGATQAAAWRSIADILNPSGITYWLVDGTLLGHVRDGRCLGYDKDIDLGIWAGDRERVSKLLRSKRLKMIRDRPHMIKTEVGGVRIDFYVYHLDEKSGQAWFEVHHNKRRMVSRYPRSLFDNLRPSVFYHKDVLIPDPPEQFLEIKYGKGWTEPVRSGWKWYSSPLNMRQEGRVSG